MFELLAVSTLLTTPAATEPRALMDQVFSRSTWQDMQGTVRLELRTKRGDTKSRELKMWSKRNAQGESSMLMRFVAPADVRGTGFLLIEHDAGEDDRRLFMPALRRVQRIATSGAGGNFMASDFTYYDVGRPKLEDWSYRAAPDQEWAGVKCVGVEGRAASAKVEEDTGYARVIWYVDPARLVVLGADYFDKADLPLKRLTVLRVDDVGGTPFATQMKVEDLNTGHVSEMRFENLITNQGLTDDLFSERNLRKWTQ